MSSPVTPTPVFKDNIQPLKGFAAMALAFAKALEELSDDILANGSIESGVVDFLVMTLQAYKASLQPATPVQPSQPSTPVDPSQPASGSLPADGSQPAAQ